MGLIAFIMLLNVIVAAVIASVKVDRRLHRGEAPGALYALTVFALVFVGALAAEVLLAYGACVALFNGYHV